MLVCQMINSVDAELLLLKSSCCVTSLLIPELHITPSLVVENKKGGINHKETPPLLSVSNKN